MLTHPCSGGNGETELGHGPIRQRRLSEITPSPENDTLYKPVDPDDPEIIRLAESIAKHGILDPIVITLDDYILSGHRRYVAAKLAGMETVPTLTHQIRRSWNLDSYVKLLREYNRQRDKTIAEKIREEIVNVDPRAAYQSLISHRKQNSAVSIRQIELREPTRRARITPAKQSFLKAVQRVVESLRDYWPISERLVHYHLLNDPPLTHASKPESRYRNLPQCYKSLTDIVTRGRLAGLIPMEAIGDETRGCDTWRVYGDVRQYIRGELSGMLTGYYRDLLISQPNHIEMLIEKNTAYGILRDVASYYCMPVTSMRGFSSLPPRAAIAARFRKSGKESLILVIMSDFDPSGEEIAHFVARSMRDDFGIRTLIPVKAGLTDEQVRRMNLPSDCSAKTGDTNYRRFVAKHGSAVYELEAVPPETLRQMLRDTLDSIIDREAFNAEIDREKADAVELSRIRQQVVSHLGEVL